MDILTYNREAWNRQVAQGNRWTIPASPDEIARARRGEWAVVLTPTKPVPADWFPPLGRIHVLALASGGGQQGPILAAAGAEVTVFDNSPAQLERDRMVAERDGLTIRTVQGDMRDLSAFADGSFDLVVHPVSNCFVPEVRPVWREAFRVLRPGGRLIAGFVNPLVFAVDPDLDAQGVAQLRYPLPYSDLESLTAQERARYTDAGEPLVFGHTLEDQIGGQLAAGFSIIGFYEDHANDDQGAIHRYMAGYMATCALKP
jgi:SAM-dependent methyltransferase